MLECQSHLAGCLRVPCLTATFHSSSVDLRQQRLWKQSSKMVMTTMTREPWQATKWGVVSHPCLPLPLLGVTSQHPLMAHCLLHLHPGIGHLRMKQLPTLPTLELGHSGLHSSEYQHNPQSPASQQLSGVLPAQHSRTWHRPDSGEAMLVPQPSLVAAECSGASESHPNFASQHDICQAALETTQQATIEEVGDLQPPAQPFLSCLSWAIQHILSLNLQKLSLPIHLQLKIVQSMHHSNDVICVVQALSGQQFDEEAQQSAYMSNASHGLVGTSPSVSVGVRAADAADSPASQPSHVAAQVPDDTQHSVPAQASAADTCAIEQQQTTASNDGLVAAGSYDTLTAAAASVHATALEEDLPASDAETDLSSVGLQRGRQGAQCRDKLQFAGICKIMLPPVHGGVCLKLHGFNCPNCQLIHTTNCRCICTGRLPLRHKPCLPNSADSAIPEVPAQPASISQRYISYTCTQITSKYDQPEITVRTHVCMHAPHIAVSW